MARLPLTVYGAFYANVATHAAATMLVWALMLSRGDYARAFSYVAVVAALRVPLVVIAYLARAHSHPAESARLAFVCVTCGGAVVGVLMVMAAISADDYVKDVAIPMLVVGLNQFDPMAMLVAVFAIAQRHRVQRSAAAATAAAADAGFSMDTAADATTTTTVAAAAEEEDEAGGSGDDAAAAVHASAATARTLGTLAGAFVFTGAWITDSVYAALLGTGAVLVSAQVPLMPLDTGMCAGATRVSTLALRATGRAFSSLASVRLALAIELAVALSLSMAIATWSYQSVALWDRAYANWLVSAWVANVVGVGVLVGAAAAARTRAVSIAPTCTGSDRTRAHRGLAPACATRLRRRLHAAGALLGGAVLVSAVLDLSLRTETPVHVIVSLAVACGAILLDQLAAQVAILANRHVAGTYLHVQLFYVLGGARATAQAIGFLLGWFWREQLHTSAIYALPFAVTAYAVSQCTSE